MRDVLLRQGGFLKDGGARRPGLVDSVDAQQNVDAYLRYESLFREMGNDPSIPDLIYENPGGDQSPGRPCGYLKVLSDPSPERIADLRLRLWNHGRIPTLWIIAANSVRIYNAFARPQERDHQDVESHLLGELRLVGDQLTGLDRFHRTSFDDGSFWRTGDGQRIDATQRVDQALLEDLQATATLLRQQDLSSAAAHSLLGRIIFVKYLEDRGILQSCHFQAFGNSEGFDELLGHESHVREFFDWLHATFNGDLFPRAEAELRSVDNRHLDILQRFLSGHLMSGYPNTQARFWPYSFKIIPIELISSIYEMFAHADNSEAAKAQSVHYTRFGLVELTLSIAMRDLSGTTRVLDPACGSGVFLVEAFRRLVWTKSNAYGRPLNREELHDVLRAQIFGIDIDRNAVYVAAFSLYLVLLEMDRDPEPLNALRLPRLVNSGAKGDGRNLYIQDFLNCEHEFNHVPPFANRDFDLVVSNPPWTALNKKTAPADPDNPSGGVQWGLRYVRRHKIPDGKPDQAFMWRARDFVKAGSRIAMVIGSRLFFQASPVGRRWRSQLLSKNTIHAIVDLSDLVNEKLLFGWKSSTRLPASVVVFAARNPDEHGELRYISPKWYPGIRNRDEIIITSADVCSLPQCLVRDELFRWKGASRGSSRDIRLLYRLGGLKSLDMILNEAGCLAGIHRGRGITIGKGESRRADDFEGIPFLEGRRKKERFAVNVRNLPIFSHPTVAKRSNRLVLGLPAVVVARSLLDYRPCAFLVEASESRSRLVISQSYYGISFPGDRLWLGNRLNALLNSDVAFYWAFMVGLELGLGRRLIEVHDWCSLPVPDSILEDGHQSWRQVLDVECRLRSAVAGSAGPSANIEELQEILNKEICALYDLSEQDIVLIRDTMKFTVAPYLKRKQRSCVRRPSEEQLASYADRICLQLNDLVRHDGRKLGVTAYVLPMGDGLCGVRFSMKRLADHRSAVRIRSAEGNAILAHIGEHLRSAVADHIYVQRDLRVYDDENFWVIKPAEDRLWSEAAALVDADLVVAEHLEASNL